MTLAPRTIELDRATHTRVTYAPDRSKVEAHITQLSHASVPFIEALKPVAKQVGLAPLGFRLVDNCTLEAGQDFSWALLSARVDNSAIQAVVDKNFEPILDRLFITPSEEGMTLEQLRQGDGINLVILLLDHVKVVFWQDTILRVI